MTNPPTSQESECFESTNDHHHSSLRRPKRGSRIFGRPFSFSGDSSRFSASLSSIQTVLQPSTAFKGTLATSLSTSPTPPVSPSHGVVAILNDMYAHTMSRGRVDSHSPRHSSLHLGGHIGGSISILGPTRSSVDSAARKSKGTVQDSLPDTGISRIDSVSDSSVKNTTREMRSGASISSGSTGSSQSKKNASTSSHDSGSSLRVVGRGGSGSKLRYVAPQLASLDPVTVRQEHPPPLVRPSGRGGFASRPKPLDAPPPQPNINPPVESSQSSFVRPSGRGGLASRPKPIGSLASPPLLKLLKTKNKRGIDKGKRKALEPIRAIHPLPPNLTYQISNGSTTTISTIHFIDETGEPSTPFFPDDGSINCETRAVSSPLSTSSIYTSEPSSSQSSILSDHTAETTEEYCNESSTSIPVDHRKRNLLKLARTLGYLPDDEAVLPTRCLTGLSSGTSESPLPLQKKDRNVKAFRRASISVTSLASMFGKSGPSTRSGRDSVATSMMTDELHHHLGLEDDLSDTSASSFCERTASPIVFSPPSPVHERNRKPRSFATGTGVIARRENLETSQNSNALESSDTLFVSSSTLSSSEYNVFTPYQRPSTHSSLSSHSRQYSTSGSALPDFTAESNKSVWLIPVKDDDEFNFPPQRYRSATPTQALGFKHASDRSGHWSGEWNEDIHQVIKSLRLL